MNHSASRIRRTAFTVLILVASVTCKKEIAAPSLDNKYDEASSAYIPTPDLNTAPVSDILALSAKSGGVFQNDYGKPVTVKGVCWSLAPNPTIEASCSSDGSATTNYTSNLTGLLPDTLYYVRAYATNEAGTIYGGQRSFRTRDGVPTFSGLAVSNLTSSGASVALTVDQDGGDPITARGVCYSKEPDPTTAGTCIASGTGTGAVAVAITGLDRATAYYVRPYATNAVMTAYGAQGGFVTTADLPTVVTGNVSGITSYSATVAGEVTATGGAPVTARGVCYATTQNPTTAGTCVALGSDTGAFSAVITGLSAVVTYYARAYAANSAGTAYGSNVQFTTTHPAFAGNLTDIDGNVYPTVQIGTQVWMASNLRTTRYRNNSSIDNVTNATTWSGLTTGAWAHYDNATANETVYGKLYNWYAVTDSRNICPTGWHVPSDAEWTVLSNFLATDVGFKMKATSGWQENGNGSNESGFNGLPGGGRLTDGAFDGVGSNGLFWGSSESNSDLAWYRDLFRDIRDLDRNFSDKRGGFSVRCVRD